MMLASDNASEAPVRRKRPMVSCRECHRRKEKCDRRQPCIRCIRRGKRDACVYELEIARSGLLPAQRSKPPDAQSDGGSASAATSAVDDETAPLGYANGLTGTKAIIQGIGAESTSLNCTTRTCNQPIASHYVGTLRELPPRRHIDLLVRMFFENVAWHYDIVDEATFSTQLSQWNRLSHHQLKAAPVGLPTSLRPFPALLFQVMAQALLFQPSRHDKILNDLKYTTDMELSDRAAEYSDAGRRIALTFRKTELDMTIIQAELMRACFEKTSGSVIEAWHTLGSAIRDAQELGLHRLEPAQDLDSVAPSSPCHQGRKLWLILHLWDAHMAVVLGRPMSTRVNPHDVPYPSQLDCSCDAPQPIRPYDVILYGYHSAYKFLQEIHDLEGVDNCQSAVEAIHQVLVGNISNPPAWAQSQRPRENEPLWLSAALETTLTNMHFVLFALHRPFIFVESSSRVAAFHSAVQILESQARLFDQTQPMQHKAFSLVFATFDAMVLIIALHIRFPSEFGDQLPMTKTALGLALDRLKLLQESNALADATSKIVSSLYQRMLAIEHPAQSMLLLDGGIGVDAWEGIEADMLGGDWDGDFAGLLPPEPLKQLLYPESF